jgi:hypothetical protein
MKKPKLKKESKMTFANTTRKFRIGESFPYNGNTNVRWDDNCIDWIICKRVAKNGITIYRDFYPDEIDKIMYKESGIISNSPRQAGDENPGQ